MADCGPDHRRRAPDRPPPTGQPWTAPILDALDERVRVVSVPNVHWTDGALVDLVAVGERAREVGARLVVDGSQSIGAMPFDVTRAASRLRRDGGLQVAARPDGRVATSTWPRNTATASRWRRTGSAAPGSEDFARLVDYRDEYQPGARRYDEGQRVHFELVPMAVAALEQLHDVAGDQHRRDARRADRHHRGTRRRLGPQPLPPEQRGPHLLGLRLPAAPGPASCANLAAAGCFAAVRGEILRIAPHLHVTDADVDRLFRALGRAAGDWRARSV